jgi:hypothetical protein
MKAIQTTVQVDAEHKATVQLPDDVAPGTYTASLILVESPPKPQRPTIMEDFPRYDVQVNLPEGYTFRREQMYDDSGRGA